MRTPVLRWPIVALCISFALATLARAATTMSVDVGFSQAHRFGRWTPLYLTISDDVTRAVTVEILSNATPSGIMLVRQSFTIGPAPSTWVLYVPVGQWVDSLAIVVRDAQTQRRLFDWPDPNTQAQMYSWSQPADQLVVTSGRGPALRMLDDPNSTGVRVRPIEPARLPAVAQGYDSVNLLVLNQPDLVRMPQQQQEAIANWVRAGGKLLIWPGTDPIPDAGPLVQMFPAHVAESRVYGIPGERVRAAGLPDRFANLPGRVLVPTRDAQAVALFGDGEPIGYRARRGFGQVLILPVDPSLFTFEDAKSAARFFRSLLTDMLDLPDPDANDENNRRSNYWNDPALTRHAEALTLVMDLLGDVPGIGRFGFAYVAAVLIFLMIIVGPVDWIVLRWLGRQPWTWFTTSGWIALVTTGAIFVGYLFRSGDLHFRSMRIVDQIDGAVVATTDMLGMYSPRTQLYTFTVDPNGWWQPAGDTRLGGRGAMGTESRFRQDYRGNIPDPTIVNVWTLRFLSGRIIAASPPVLTSSLRLHGARLVGRVTNLSDHAISELAIFTSAGSCWIRPAIAPGASISIDQEIRANLPNGPVEPAGADDKSEPQISRATPFWKWCDLSAERSERIAALLGERDDVACIYALVSDPPASVKLDQPGAIERHWQVVRAVEPISTSP